MSNRESKLEKGITSAVQDNSLAPLKCYCGFECDTENELKSHVLKAHGARDGDWKGWVSHE